MILNFTLKKRKRVKEKKIEEKKENGEKQAQEGNSRVPRPTITQIV